MNTETIEERYRNLCLKTEKYCQKHENDEGMRFLGFHAAGFPDMDYEINAWTYWQGIGNVGKDIKILVIGQDWGSVNKEFCRRFLDNIIADRPYFYGMEDDYIRKTDETDYNLMKIFEAHKYPDLFHTRYDDLFFTNILPGFREGNVSGGDASSWINNRPEIQEFLKELVGILKPQNVVCLGQPVFEGTMKSFGLPVPKEKASNLIDNGPFQVNVDDNKVNVYAMAHPGFYGKNNRNRFSDEGNLEHPLKLLISDWDKVFC